MDKNITRRRLFKATPALAAIPAVALAESESLHRRLHQEWRAAEVAFEASPFDGGTPEATKLVHRVNEIQEAAMAIEPRTVEDMAFR